MRRRGVWQRPGVGGGKGLDLMTSGSINSRCHHSHHHYGFGSKLLGLKSHSAIYYIGGLVTQSHLTLVTPWGVACQAPLSLGILQARILEWVAISFSSGSSWPKDRTWVSCIAGRRFILWASREAKTDPKTALKNEAYFFKKSPTYKQVPFQERICKSNLFLSPRNLA